MNYKNTRRTLIRAMLNRIPERVRSYAIALAFWLGILLLSALLFPLGKVAVSFCSLLLLLMMLAAAWLGYGPGVLVCVLTLVVAPRVLYPARPHRFDPVNLGLVLVVMLLISAVAAWKRRTEAALRVAAETLETRVAERTRELFENQERLREQAELLDLATDAILVNDLNGAILFWNRGAEELYRSTASDAHGQIAHQLLKTVFPEPLPAIQATLLSAGAWQGELIHSRPDGLRVTVMSRWALRRNAQGEPCGWLETNTDITARRRMEAQLRQSQKMEAVGRLAGGISHDFNNLLTVINGYADMALEEPLATAAVRDAIEEISAAGHRAADLTRGLLAFSRKQILQPAAVDLAGIITGIEKMLRRLLGEDVDMITVLSPGLWEVHADRSQLEQVIVNLAVNARDAMPSGGALTIEAGNTVLDETYAGSHLGVEPGAYVLLAVSDTGHGIDQETQSHIFEPFFTTKAPGKGTGLGLATAYGIVQQSGGTITVYSEPGHGTTFKVYLPRALAAASAPTPKAGVAAVPRRSGTETILLVEDDDSLCKLTTAILHRHGFRVIAARNAAEALVRCRSEAGAIDLVLSDLVMPQMSGQQLAAEIQQRYPDLKVVFMSGYTEHMLVNQIALNPAVLFVSKPFTAATLIATLQKALDKAVSVDGAGAGSIVN
jgi:two-component system cell cycle sensor histidine kinase/response regulator CckA